MQQRTRRYSLEEIKELLGDPVVAAREMRAYAEKAESWEYRLEALQRDYPNMWVALLDGDDVLVDSELEGLFSQLERRGLDRRRTYINHVPPLTPRYRYFL